MATNVTKKPLCKYGDKCYRKNRDHFKKYDHSAENIDEDSADENTSPSSVDSNKSATSDKPSIRDDSPVKKSPNSELPDKGVDSIERFDFTQIKSCSFSNRLKNVTNLI